MRENAMCITNLSKYLMLYFFDLHRPGLAQGSNVGLFFVLFCFFVICPHFTQWHGLRSLSQCIFLFLTGNLKNTRCIFKDDFFIKVGAYGSLFDTHLRLTHF